jgi:1-acyl-sn-glycerol-3-phosphate acyltransferase
VSLEHPRRLEVLEKLFVVRAGKWFVREFSTYFHDLKVLMPFPELPPGGAILVCNHTSSLDPVLLQAACPRLITWMMAKEYAYMFGGRWFFEAIEPILVERSGRDLAATRSALRALKDGKLLGLFPEGRIEKSRELLEFQTGVALLAMKSGAPVYPAFLDGGQRCKGMVEAFFVPNRITVAFGPVVHFNREAHGREGLELATRRIKEAVEALSKITR